VRRRPELVVGLCCLIREQDGILWLKMRQWKRERGNYGDHAGAEVGPRMEKCCRGGSSAFSEKASKHMKLFSDIMILLDKVGFGVNVVLANKRKVQ
jgi:hypothetical protein